MAAHIMIKPWGRTDGEKDQVTGRKKQDKKSQSTKSGIRKKLKISKILNATLNLYWRKIEG